jgi:predicted Zn-dependent protease
MTFAGYDPEEALRFWVRMSRMNQAGSRIPEFLSDHPSDAERVRNMQQWVPMALAGKRAFDEGHIAAGAR